ncbi:MAG: hypothetical protein JW793_05565 [Acidobacteria bacterium]|nr:hypothetical protein [Acidobacteriota bacterium]
MALPDDSIEVPVDGYTVDIVRGGLLIEIQTANLSRIRRKLTKLLERHTVRLVYPIARDLWIVRQPGGGRKVPSRRKSPKRGAIESVFEELVGVAGLLAHPGFTLHVLMIEEEQVRRCDRPRRRGRKGYSSRERRLLKVLDQWVFRNPQDMQSLLPESLPEFFTTEDLAAAIGLPLWLAQKMAYCLRLMAAVAVSGKRGRWILYRRAEDRPAAFADPLSNPARDAG